MKIKIITLLLLFVLTKAGMSQNVDRTRPTTYDILYKSLSRNFNKVLYPLYYPNSLDVNNWIDSSFFIHVVFPVDSAGFISKYQITNAIKFDDSITLSKVFAPIVRSRFQLQDRALYNKSLSLIIFCYSQVLDDSKLLNDKCNVSITDEDLFAIQEQELLKNSVRLPIMPMPIAGKVPGPKQVVRLKAN